MNIRFLEAFIWVARLKGFRAAAEKLNVSQATISSRISTLEAELNCKLFDRTRNEINISDKGLMLLEDAERVLAAERTLKNNMASCDELVGRLRIGAIESVVHTWLGIFLKMITQKFPALEFELTIEPTPSLQNLFAKGALDLILQTDSVSDEGVNNTPLSDLEMVWACRFDNPITEKTVKLSDIGKQQIITFARGSQPHLSMLTKFAEQEIKPPQIHCITSISAINVLVAQGLGIATVPAKALDSEPVDKRIVVINTNENPSPLKLVACWHRHSTNSAIEDIIRLAKEASFHYQ
ncbi:LysR family transcriptional regulator [Leucothrix sargassi]|nr:LysR family transcriptional regulator [Leucothrix sargassi]